MGFQIKINDEWLWCSTSSGERYEYPSQQKASEMASICYPDQIREHRLGGECRVRVRETPDDHRG